MRFLPCACTFFAVPCLFLAAVAAQPSITRTTPGALTPGKTIELTVQGAKLDEPLNLWTSFSANIEPITEGRSPTVAKFRITLDPNTSVGIGGLIVATPAGVSDPLLLMVDDLGSVQDNNKNHSPSEAQTVPFPIAVDGVGNGSQADFYKFSAKQGQRIAVEVISARIGSTFDPLLSLLDASGREVIQVDDDPALGADCRFALKIPADGDYVIVVRDSKFQGSGNYRLRIGDFPLINTAFPLSGKRGSDTSFAFTGEDVAGIAALNVNLPTDASVQRVAISAKFPGGLSSSSTTIVSDELPPLNETEPNDSHKSPMRVTLPAAISGQLQSQGDRDFYEFTAKKGEHYSFAAASRSLGSAAYLFMQIYNADGGKLAETPIGDAAETTLAYTFTADGSYRLLVEDLNRAGGPSHAYRVAIPTWRQFRTITQKRQEFQTEIHQRPRRWCFCFGHSMQAIGIRRTDNAGVG